MQNEKDTQQRSTQDHMPGGQRVMNGRLIRALLAAALAGTVLWNGLHSAAARTAPLSAAERPVERATATDPTVNQSAVASAVSFTSTSAGRDFWLAFPPSIAQTPQALIVYVTGRQAASGRISIRDNTFSPVTFSVTPGQVTKVELSGTLVANVHPARTRAGVSDKGIHLTATVDVNVYGLDYESQDTDAYQAIPSHATGQEHVVASYWGLWGPSTVVVVAQEDNTRITATLQITDAWVDEGYPVANSVTVYTHTLNATPVVTTMVLNAGQVYQAGAESKDVSGTIIESDKPVVVYGHSSCTYVPIYYGYCDMLIETMPPVPTWGKRYVGMPTKGRARSDTFRIYGSEANTTVRVNGGDPWNIGRGQWIEYRTQLTDTKYFVADKPIMVQQYFNGTEIDTRPGDPSMLTVVPLGQGMTSYTFATPKDKPQPGGDAEFTNTVNVLVPDVAGARVYVDGVQVTGMTAAQDSGFLYASVSITPGTHAATGTVPFQVMVYGLRAEESYAYPAGSSYLRVEDISSVSVSPEGEYVVQDGARCFTATALSSASPVSGVTTFLFDGYGKVITAGVTNASGQIAACYTGQPGERGLTALVGSQETTANVYWKNDDADVIGITVSPGALAPAFVTSTSGYTVTVTPVTTSTLVTPTLSDPNAHYTMTSSPGACAPTTGGGQVTPTVHACETYGGRNIVTVTVKAEDGIATKDYALQVLRPVCAAVVAGNEGTVFSSLDAQAVRDAVAAASAGDVVKIAGTCAGVVDTRLVGVTKTLTLRGGYTFTNWTTANLVANPTVLNAQGAGRVITATAPITVENLTIQNGFGTDFSPGAVSVNGGGMYATAAVVVSNTTFVDNRTGRLNTLIATGGALWAGDTATIVASRFLTNSAGTSGGAYINGYAVLRDTSFISNTAVAQPLSSGAPGGLKLDSSGSIEGGIFERNTSSDYGGAVRAKLVHDLTISGTQFLSNTSQNGGGMFVEWDRTRSKMLIMTNTVFVNNGSLYGGGLYLDYAVSALISGSRFERNLADGGGAALSLDGYFTRAVRIENSVFLSNTANGQGAAIWAYRSDPEDVEDVLPLELVNSVFTGNAVVGGSPQVGGAVSSGRRTLVTDSVFTDNTAVTGGALHVEYDRAILVNTTFVSNTATSGDGGGAALFSGGVIEGGRFEANSAVNSGGGGVYAVMAADLTISGTQFVSNTAASGGGVRAERSDPEAGRAYVTSTTFMSNTATGDGGGVFVNGAGSLERSYLLRNAAGVDGGGAYFVGNAEVVNNVFAGNVAGEAGDLYFSAGLNGSHNTFAGTGTAVAVGAAASAPAMGVLTNSLMAGYTVAADADVTGTIELRGLLWDGGTLATSGTVTVSGLVTGSAGFVDAAGGNYLALGDGVDAGVNSGVATDIRGEVRPQSLGYDLGAYEAGDVQLIDLSISPGTLAPAFVSATNQYTTLVPALTTSMRVTATTSDVSATVAVASSAGACAPGNASSADCAITGPKTWITATVTSADGLITNQYFIEVTVLPSSDANLINLEIAPGRLAPTFVSGTTSYAANVPDGTTMVAVTATLSDPNATYTITGSPGACAPATSPAACALEVGVNVITVTVTAADGSTSDYVMVVTRADANTPSDANLLDLTIDPGTLAPAFASSTTSYAAVVANEVELVTVTATPSDPAATVTFAPCTSDVPTAHSTGGGHSATCALVVGVNHITVTVTATNGDAQPYVIVVTRVAPLTIGNVWPRTGLPAGGMPVAILGGGFTGALSVTVDGQEVPYTVTNDGRIDVVMPPGTDGQSVDFVVTTPAGSATAAQAFTYVAPAVFEVDAATGGVVTATGGVTLVVPPQPGVTGTLVITVESQPPTTPTPGTLLMHSFVVQVTLNGQPYGVLGEAMTLTLEVDPAVVPSGETPTLYVLQPTVWTRIPGQTYGVSTRQVTGRVTRPGSYAVSTVLLREYWFPIVPLQE